MGLQELQARIKKDAGDEVTKIAADAKKEADVIYENFKAKAADNAERIRKDGDVEVKRVKKRILADAGTQVKEMVSAEKNRLLDKAFDAAAKKILALGDDEKKKVMKTLAEEGKKSIKDPVFLVDEKYRGLLPGSEGAKLDDFGVIITNKDRNQKIDNTLGSRQKQLKNTLKPQVASILFAEDGSTVSDR